MAEEYWPRVPQGVRVHPRSQSTERVCYRVLEMYFHPPVSHPSDHNREAQSLVGDLPV